MIHKGNISANLKAGSYLPYMLCLGTCDTVQCVMSEWSQWSATCGHASRSICIVARHIKVEKASCDGLPTKCPDAEEVVTRKEPACKSRLYFYTTRNIIGLCGLALGLDVKWHFSRYEVAT